MNSKAEVRRRWVIRRRADLAVERQETTDGAQISHLVHDEERSAGKPILFLDDVDRDRKTMYSKDDR